MLNDFLSVYKGKKVFVTGSTGFKGSWLCQWLLNLGADVTGYALEPPTNPSIFENLKLGNRINQHIADINNFEEFKTLYKNKLKEDALGKTKKKPKISMMKEVIKEKGNPEI